MKLIIKFGAPPESFFLEFNKSHFTFYFFCIPYFIVLSILKVIRYDFDFSKHLTKNTLAEKAAPNSMMIAATQSRKYDGG